MNGGYILLDLTKYDLSTDCGDDEGLYGDAYEITENDYNEIVNKIKYSYIKGKFLMVKANAYDDVYVNGVCSYRYAGQGTYYTLCYTMSYRDITDDFDAYIFVLKGKNNKFYIGSSSTIH